MGRERIREYFSEVETTREYNGCFCSVGEGADNRDIGLYVRLTQHQSNPSMGIEPKSKRVLVEAFRDKYHTMLLLAVMPFKAH
jgi:hypothetical protein